MKICPDPLIVFFFFSWSAIKIFYRPIATDGFNCKGGSFMFTVTFYSNNLG